MRKIISVLQDYFGTAFLTGAEVGVERGDNAEGLLIGLQLSRLYLIDIWCPFIQHGQIIWNDQICEENFRFVCNRFKDYASVAVVRQASVQAVHGVIDGSLDFVYIDACHQYESVFEDLEIWFKKVRNGGILAGHDYCSLWPGVVKAVNEFGEKYRLKFCHGLTDNGTSEDWWIYR